MQGFTGSGGRSEGARGWDAQLAINGNQQDVSGGARLGAAATSDGHVGVGCGGHFAGRLVGLSVGSLSGTRLGAQRAIDWETPGVSRGPALTGISEMSLGGHESCCCY